MTSSPVDDEVARRLLDRLSLLRASATTSEPPWGLALVANYGRKSTTLTALLTGLQAATQQALGRAATLRPIGEIHSTLLGVHDPELVGTSALSLASGDCDRLASYLSVVSERLHEDPFAVRFGGYVADEDYGMRSRGLPLYERSFTVTADRTTCIGWPWRHGRTNTVLDDLRRAAEEFGLHHKYISSTEDVDPDSYMVIADVMGSVDEATMTALAEEGRSLMSRHPTEVSMTPQSLSLIAYTDNHLPRATSHVWQLQHLTT